MKKIGNSTEISIRSTSAVALYAPVESIVFYRENMPALQRDFIVGYKSPRIAELAPVDIHIECSSIIETLYVEIGDKHTAAEDKEALVSLFVKEVKRHLTFFSLADIRNALSMGVRGEFKRKLFSKIEDSNISLILLITWIQEYRNYNERKTVVFSQIEFDAAEKEEIRIQKMTESLKISYREKREKFYQEYTESLKYGKNIIHTQNNFYYYWFPFLTDNKILVLNSEEKEKIWGAAKGIVELRYADILKTGTGDMKLTSKKKRMLANFPEDYKSVNQFKKSCTDVEQQKLIIAIIIDIQTEAKRRAVDKFITESIYIKFDLITEIKKFENYMP